MILNKQKSFILFVFIFIVISLCEPSEIGSCVQKEEYCYVAKNANFSLETNPHTHKEEYHPIVKRSGFDVIQFGTTTTVAARII